MKEYECIFKPSDEKIIVKAHNINEASIKAYEAAPNNEWASVHIDAVAQQTVPYSGIGFVSGAMDFVSSDAECGVYDKSDIARKMETRLEGAERADDLTRQSITSTDSPQSSGWATLYRVCGGIAFVFGLIGTIAVAQKNEEAGFQLAVMAIALTLTCFLFAFLIDVLTDMRHYLKRIAEKQ